ncbi:hypothetical protein N9H03_01370 [Flavobacteriales bacterium]|nr:hypothetical protein [Flavobacteriales bacterium]
MMLYVTGGLVGGSISEVFKLVGIKVGVIPINLIWVALLIGAVALFYRINNKAIKYAALIVIAVLVYVVDMIASTIPYSFFDSIDKDVTLISNITIGFLVVSKSLIVSFIIHSIKEKKVTGGMIFNKIILLTVLGTLALSFLMGFISIEFLGDYGWTVFILIPFLIGFIPPYVVGLREGISKKGSYALSFVTLGIACVCLLLFAIEGIICIAMASPILGLVTWLSSYLGYRASTGTNQLTPNNTTALLAFCSLAFMGFDYASKVENTISVKTRVIVNASIEKVWENVVTFNEIPEPVDWIFKTGISYPVNATIEGTGVGSVRYCNFSTGSFVEPITNWQEPTLLQFDVKEQPIPMNEWNPFWEIHPPHLDGYFQSHRGQFKLTEMSKGKTELEGTTWYTVNIQPEFYWTIWSDFIIHRIHKRVLNHIKDTSEK